jgi:hypothetical protein
VSSTFHHEALSNLYLATADAAADIVDVDNEILNPEDIYDFVSPPMIAQKIGNPLQLEYYCTYRNFVVEDRSSPLSLVSRMSDFTYHPPLPCLGSLGDKQQSRSRKRLPAQVLASIHHRINHCLFKANTLNILPYCPLATRLLGPSDFLLIASWVRWKILTKEREPKFMTNVQRMPILSRNWEENYTFLPLY